MYGNTTCNKLLSLFRVKQLSLLNSEELVDCKRRAALPCLRSLKRGSTAGMALVVLWAAGELGTSQAPSSSNVAFHLSA